eukprot:Tbor_TRINITY_DN3077_c0_g1::TRINITY_DN3077_c0_g1_i1::g.17300::m.17300/K14004/SEC13; protein transport protein SEC13
MSYTCQWSPISTEPLNQSRTIPFGENHLPNNDKCPPYDKPKPVMLSDTIIDTQYGIGLTDGSNAVITETAVNGLGNLVATVCAFSTDDSNSRFPPQPSMRDNSIRIFHIPSNADANRVVASERDSDSMKNRSVVMGNTNKTVTPKQILTGAHQGPVMRLAWAPPRCVGFPLASCGLEDCQVVIWRAPPSQEDTVNTNKNTQIRSISSYIPAKWDASYTAKFPAPVVCLQWAPEEYGTTLACACADGRVYIIDNANPSVYDAWNTTSFDAHIRAGCTGVSWAPYLPSGALISMPLNTAQLNAMGAGCSGPQVPVSIPRLVTCGNERTVRIWRFSKVERVWLHEHDLDGCPGLCNADGRLRDSSMLDVSWAPNIGLPFSYIAAGSSEGCVTIWLQDTVEDPWRVITLPPFRAPVVKVQWSGLLGTFLMVSCADNTMSIWKEEPSGDWEQMTRVSPLGYPPK